MGSLLQKCRFLDFNQANNLHSHVRYRAVFSLVATAEKSASLFIVHVLFQKWGCFFSSLQNCLVTNSFVGLAQSRNHQTWCNVDSRWRRITTIDVSHHSRLQPFCRRDEVWVYFVWLCAGFAVFVLRPASSPQARFQIFLPSPLHFQSQSVRSDFWAPREGPDSNHGFQSN